MKTPKPWPISHPIPKIYCVSPLDPHPSPINLTCNRIVNETTGNIAVLSLWTVGDDPRTVGAIDHYTIHVTIVQIDDSDIWILKNALLSDSSVPAKVCAIINQSVNLMLLVG